jgi:hypothetical protein
MEISGKQRRAPVPAFAIIIEYLDFADSQRGIGRFVESVYNEKRLHSALGYSFEGQSLPEALIR